MMKTFPEYLEQVSKQYQYDSWDDCFETISRLKGGSRQILKLIEIANKRYAKQTAQDTLNRAATRATADIQNGKAVIEKSSILTTEIRLV